MKKVVLAYDSFKGSLSSKELSSLSREAILNICPDCEVIERPIADGGEGTTVAIASALDVQFITCEVKDPLMRTIEASYAITSDNSTAIMEMAVASGLPLVEVDKRNPILTTSFGTGELIKDAIYRGCKKIILGIGGSATNDAGMGLLAALGVKFIDVNGNNLEPIGKNLINVTSVDTSALKQY